MAAPEQWQITLCGPDGRRCTPRTVVEDIDQQDRFREHLLAIARVEDPMNTDSGDNWIGLFELEVRRPGHESIEAIFRWVD